MCKSLGNIQNRFHSAVNAFTALERKHDEIVGIIKLVGEERRLRDHIVRIIVLLKVCLLQIEQGFCMGKKDKKHPHIKRIGNKVFYSFGFMGNCLNYLQQFDRNARESCLAGQYLQCIGLDNVEQQCMSVLKQRNFKHSGIKLKSLRSLQIILEKHKKSICKPFQCKLGQYPRLSFQEISSTVNVLYILDIVLNFMNGDLCLSM